jgi:hypothetical protein
MINDFISSVRDNIRDKTGNPFFGALIILWSIKNWNLIYSILNFDESTSLVQKRKFIIQHFTDRPFLKTLAFCVLEVLLILIISYFFINLSRFIVNLYEKRLTPLVYKWTDSSSIVLKSVFKASENERLKLEKRAEEERDARLKLQEEYDKLERKYGDLWGSKGVDSDRKASESKEVAERSEIEISYDYSKERLVIQKLEREHLLWHFKNIASMILNSQALRGDDSFIEEMVTLGLFKRVNKAEKDDYYYYILTATGIKVHELILMEDLKQ